jgi:hypothetical protein
MVWLDVKAVRATIARPRQLADEENTNDRIPVNGNYRSTSRDAASVWRVVVDLVHRSATQPGQLCS